MKKNGRIFALLLAAVTALSLIGCGADSRGSDVVASQTYTAAAVGNSVASFGEMMAPEPEEISGEESGDSGYSFHLPTAEPGIQIAQVDPETGEAIIPGGDSAPEDMSEKIVYNSEVTLETTEFDETLDKIAALVQELGGYMESTSISGSNYSSIARGDTGTRSAYYEIRIPSANFDQLNSDLAALGNVPYSRTYTENVTTQYYDVKSRLDAYQAQEDRLLEMLSLAETVEDMISIQQQLTEVQYEIDSLTGTLRYYDNQVSSSTVDLTVEEVQEYTPSPTVTLSYWERMRQRFGESLHATGRFFKEGFLWLVTSLPWLVPVAAAAVLAIWLVRRWVVNRPKRAEKRAARKGTPPEAPSISEEENEEKKG